jgi:hypothetical protein
LESAEIVISHFEKGGLRKYSLILFRQSDLPEPV